MGRVLDSRCTAFGGKRGTSAYFWKKSKRQIKIKNLRTMCNATSCHKKPYSVNSPVKITRNVYELRPKHDHLLSIESSFGNSRSQATQHVSGSINLQSLPAHRKEITLPFYTNWRLIHFTTTKSKLEFT